MKALFPEREFPADMKLPSLVRDPLLQFLVGGVLLFGLIEGAHAWRSAAERRIVIDSAVRARLADLFRVEKGRAPDAVERAGLVDRYIDDEVLYREAVRLGLDRDDEIVRRRLIQKMTFLSDRSVAARQPTDAELERFYRDNAARFAAPAARSFRHLYFSPDAGDEAGRRRAEAALAALRRGAAPEGLGDRFPLQNSYSRLSGADADRIFGLRAFADALFAAPVGQWSGPFRSGYGWHVVRVDQSVPGAVPPFDPRDEDVRTAYVEARSQKARADRLAELRRRYEIIGARAP